MSKHPAVAAIVYASSLPDDECRNFCDAWVHGDFETIAMEFTGAPEDVYIKASDTYEEPRLISEAKDLVPGCYYWFQRISGGKSSIELCGDLNGYKFITSNRYWCFPENDQFTGVFLAYGPVASPPEVDLVKMYVAPPERMIEFGRLKRLVEDWRLGVTGSNDAMMGIYSLLVNPPVENKT